MDRRKWRRAGGLAVSALLWLVIAVISSAQQAPVTPAPDHGCYGTPEARRFSWPAGNPPTGRDVFVKLECYTCHEVKGETFPAPDPGPDSGKVGPELSAMAPLHPEEYFAEAIINPNAAVEEGKGYRAPDGKSKMPSYNDLVTVQEVIDLVAYLKGLRGVGATTDPGGMPGSSGDT